MSLKAPNKINYSTTVTSTGGRAGKAKSDDNALEVELSVPKAIGGDGGPGTNPEQLFAAGYSACFMGAMQYFADNESIELAEDFSVSATVGIGPVKGGMAITVKFDIQLTGMDQDQANELIEKAHGFCPYSNATRDNIEIDFSIHT